MLHWTDARSAAEDWRGLMNTNEEYQLLEQRILNINCYINAHELPTGREKKIEGRVPGRR